MKREERKCIFKQSKKLEMKQSEMKMKRTIQIMKIYEIYINQSTLH